MWPVLANQLGLGRAAQKRLDKSSDVISASLALTLDKKPHLRDALPPPWGPQPKLVFKGGWLKRIAARNHMHKFFLRAQ